MFKLGCSVAKKIGLSSGGNGGSGSSSKGSKHKDKDSKGADAIQEPPDLNDIPQAKSDPRIPLNARQIFKISKSWKAIARTMSKTGTAMFLNLFEQNQDLFYLFERFQHLKGTELQESMELREHAATVMSTLDESINSLNDYDNFVAYLHSIGELHRKVPGFKRAHFWKIEQPFMKAVKQTLDERCNETIEEIYKIAIKLIIETIADGYGEDASADESTNQVQRRRDDRDDQDGGANGNPNANQNKDTTSGYQNKSSPSGSSKPDVGHGCDATAPPGAPSDAVTRRTADLAQSAASTAPVGDANLQSLASSRLGNIDWRCIASSQSSPRRDPARPTAGRLEQKRNGSRCCQQAAMIACSQDAPASSDVAKIDGNLELNAAQVAEYKQAGTLEQANGAAPCDHYWPPPSSSRRLAASISCPSATGGAAKGANLAKSRPTWRPELEAVASARSKETKASASALGAASPSARATIPAAANAQAANLEHERRIKQTLAILGQLLAMVSKQPQQQDAASHKAHQASGQKVGEQQKQHQADDNDSSSRPARGGMQIASANQDASAATATASPLARPDNEICLTCEDGEDGEAANICAACLEDNSTRRQDCLADRACSLEPIVIVVAASAGGQAKDKNTNSTKLAHCKMHSGDPCIICYPPAASREDDQDHQQRPKAVMSQKASSASASKPNGPSKAEARPATWASSGRKTKKTNAGHTEFAPSASKERRPPGLVLRARTCSSLVEMKGQVGADNDLKASTVVWLTAGQQLGALPRSRLGTAAPLAQLGNSQPNYSLQPSAEAQSDINNCRHYQRHWGLAPARLAMGPKDKLQRSISLTSLQLLVAPGLAPTSAPNAACRLTWGHERNYETSEIYDHQQRDWLPSPRAAACSISDGAQRTGTLARNELAAPSSREPPSSSTSHASNRASAGELGQLSDNSAELLHIIQMLLSTVQFRGSTGGTNKIYAIASGANQLSQVAC